jgi:transcriptional regulator with XRE-family HTH domain
MSYDEIIKKIRISYSLTLKGFAPMVGVHFTTLSHYESGRRHPSIKVIRKLIELAHQNNINVTVEDFLT